jgi:hypothetical protein
MRYGIRDLVPALAMVATLAAAPQVQAQGAPQSAPIEIEYVKPLDPYLLPVYERVKSRHILEELKRFLSPLILPVTLRIRYLQCNETNSFWAGRVEGLKLCYEYVDWIERLAPATTTPDGFTREDAIVGGIVEVAIHEMGHASFDLFNVPIFGREEDAADQAAGFIMMQFGPDVALRTMSGTIFQYQEQAKEMPFTGTMFSDVHGTNEQRLYNYLCIAYGAQPATFQRYVDTKLLPQTRAADCAREYQQVKRAFDKTILPNVDQELMKKVQAMKVLRPDDGVVAIDDATPPRPNARPPVEGPPK